ncbi:hypothetical protein PHLGIDRAFT_123440 [Phlebiopsis gigantea 11061_1 CR5-6]|uniref:Uncharacterized protein n=1 Tax=Phlebiopsis gigantea (strain 11061_1 CR5-6) TaxID=745531 RepID=A0A0C3RYM8_PHLG1|nr:hypothetical protein PHLGIDRAFT_123440 [Phlebiopsis gigantea 11061_1 CR5-6]
MARSSNPRRVLRSNGTTTEAVPLGPQMAVNGAAAAGEADSTATATMQRSSMPETTAEGGEYELMYVIYARRTDHEKESHLAWQYFVQWSAYPPSSVLGVNFICRL